MKFTSRHGHSAGGEISPEYQSWYSMRCRCNNPNASNYARYGGRGIRVHERWDVFENFLADLGPRPSPSHTLDRIDVDGNYEPGNCRWATWQEQHRNRRNNHRLSFRGETLTVQEWSERIGIPVKTLHERLRRGLSTERALTQPLRAIRRKQ